MRSGRVQKDRSNIDDKTKRYDLYDLIQPPNLSALLRLRRKMRSHKSILIYLLLLIAVSLYYLRISHRSVPQTDQLANGPLADEAKELVSESTNTLSEDVPFKISGENLSVEETKRLEQEETGKQATVEGIKDTLFELDNKRHPIWQLIQHAEQKMTTKLANQSKTLGEAVAEYNRRYGIPPPPHFDKWFQFAKERQVVLMDEFDGIHQSLTPFWALKPSTIRARAREALGGNNNLLGMIIRDGKVVRSFGGRPWLEDALKGMMRGFVDVLPDMDLCFNVHDEPRVVIPRDDMMRLTKSALEVQMPAAAAVISPRNSWSERPAELGDGSRIERTMLTRFNIFAHQYVWSHSTMSCPVDSAARDLEDGPKSDNNATYAVTELGFIYNRTAFTDICENPSYSESYGFFAAPNAMNVVHNLFPIFSESKISSYSDIVYPSPWYWSDKAAYNETEDVPWEEKKSDLYWRGSTTGGYSRNGGWRHQHRQRLVQKVNAKGQATILVDHSITKDETSMVESSDGQNFMEEEGKPTGNLGAKNDDSTQQQLETQQQEDKQSEFPIFKASGNIQDVNEEERPESPMQVRQAANVQEQSESTKKTFGKKSITLKSDSTFSDPSPPPLTSVQHPDWQPITVPRSTYKALMNISFSHIGQCDPGDCTAQKEFFTVTPPLAPSVAWLHKYLLDIDGNAFSGRFYSFLRSRSQVFKMAVFREWHEDWLIPWQHYVPLSLRGMEWLEAVRWFSEDDVGKEEGREMAARSREWAERTLRNEDLEIWFFRLLLEYGRVVDDARGEIGFAL